MNDKERREVLIDFAEGTLPKDRIQEIENMFKEYPEYRSELEIIQSAFKTLQSLPTETVPDHYFSNILPRLRKTIENGVASRRWSLPAFIHPFLQPSIVVVILVILLGLYETFSPDPGRPLIYDLVSQIEQNQIGAVIDEPVSLATVSTEYIIESKIDAEYFGIDASQFQNESDLLALLEDKELELVVEQFENKSIQ